MATGYDSDGSDAEGKARKKLKVVQSDTKRRATKAKTSSRRHTGSRMSGDGDGLSRADSRQSRVITPAGFDDKMSPNKTKASFDMEPLDKDPKMNHPHIKGGGTLFMGAHIHKDL